MTRRCAECSKILPKNSNSQRKYCSDNCRKLASKHRNKAPHQTPIVKQLLQQTTEIGDTGTPESYEDLLQLSLHALQKAVRDEETPAQAMAALTKQLLAVGKELDSVRREREQDILNIEGVELDGDDEQTFNPTSL